MIKKFQFFHLFILISVTLLVFAFFICTCNHSDVMNQYKKGNIHARDLLLNGLNEKNSSQLNCYLIEKALDGDEDAKNIIYAQIETLKGERRSKTTYIPVCVPIQTRR